MWLADLWRKMSELDIGPIEWIALSGGCVAIVAVFVAFGYRLFLWAAGRGFRPGAAPPIDRQVSRVMNVVVYGFLGVMAVVSFLLAFRAVVSQ
jgi:hypothetical protein